MTDHTAPERIWAIPDMDDVPRRHWDCGVWREDKDDAVEIHGEPVIEYIRADLHRAEVDALVAERDELKESLMSTLQREAATMQRAEVREEAKDAEILRLNTELIRRNDELNKASDRLEDARAALRAHTEAAVRRALEAVAAKVAQYDLNLAEIVAATDPAQFVEGGE